MASAEVSLGAEKKKWGPGPWQDEPDRLEFEHVGLPCLIVRSSRSGVLCGYVAVPPGHPWHGKNFGDVDGDVHGGLTYSAKCAGRICHVPKPGEPDDVWWLGFDCSHLYDVRPGDAALFASLPQYATAAALMRAEPGSVYRTMPYVRGECARLAEQAKAAT